MIPAIKYIKPNFIEVTIKTNLNLYFSYETLIAFRVKGNFYIAENTGSSTTGKHLNYINPDKSIRLNQTEFRAAYAEIIGNALYLNRTTTK